MHAYLDEQLLEQVSALAGRAGEAIMAVYQRDFDVTHKADESPLTEADCAAHRLIMTGLAELEPRLPVLSEEDVTGFKGPDAEGRYWLVDPLDGTKEFIKRNGDFTVNIALVEQGCPVLGVVFAPVTQVGWRAAKGLGAWRYDSAGAAPIKVRKHRSEEPWHMLRSRSHPSVDMQVWLEAMRRKGEVKLESVGSSLKFCYIAEGRADLYPRLGPTSLWDTAAAQAVLEEAGGAVIRLDGQALSYEDTDEVLNPWFIARGESDVDWAEFATRLFTPGPDGA
ncbi:3'(2'),5'-bisphosphate nucleotidase CysQ [Marinobacterium litorale]|uniref:3'(2'),5'-bisphosphate nucleotidase CysQ n=1 Tax=Marinobacterium litorale TaxID=404770 RepID=UPI0004095ED1|nr:3'(2'),5'-bisphosphate nucleotidase CysQ [Marinobacterium litorale]